MPEQIGPYQIAALLGEGGMGVVYRATHAETGVHVALKTVKSNAEGIVQNMRREINTLSRLSHPGIAQLQEHGEDRGVPWYAMSFIQGISLRAWASSQSPQQTESDTSAWWTSALSSESAVLTSELNTAQSVRALSTAGASQREVLLLVRKLCEALSYLHGEGFVHRDLKPENVIITAEGAPILVDFGLSTISGTRESREEITSIRNVAGSVFYISPEQARGEFTDARADLYSLGCILFELLAGRPPFSGGNVASVLYAHATLSAPLLSSLTEGVSPSLDLLLQRLLEKEPRRRIGYADSLAYFIDKLLNVRGDPISSRPYLYRPGFQGRVEEGTQLRQALQSLQQGRGGALFISGPSGVGKTRMALESLRGAKQVFLLTGECVASSSPLHPLRSSLQRLADRCRERGESETARIFGERGALLSMYEPSLLSLWESLPPLSPLPPREAKQRLYRTLSETFASASRGQPLILLLDNLHRADALTKGWLSDWILHREFARAPILLIGLYCHEPGLEALVQASGLLSLSLSPLSMTEVSALISDMLAIELTPPSLAETVYRASGGNPYFAAAYLRAALDGQHLQRDALGQWQVNEETRLRDSFDVLSQSVRDLLFQKILALAEEPLLILQVVSLLEHVSVRAIREISALSISSMLRAFDVLQRADLLQSDEEGSPRLTLESIREIALGLLSEEDKRSLYSRAAEHLASTQESLFLAASIARFWSAAGQAQRAAEWFVRAALHASLRYAYEEAESCYRAYFSLLVGSTRESITARKEFAEKVLFVSGKTAEAQHELEAAIAEAESIGELRVTAECLQTVGQVYWRLGQVDRARVSCERALQIARQLKARDLEGKLYNSLAVLEHEQGKSEAAAKHYEQAIAIHLEVGDKAAEVVSVSNLAVLRHWQNKIPEAIQLFARALSLHQEAGSLRSAAQTELNFAAFWVSQKNYQEAQQLIEHALQSFVTIGDKQLEALAQNSLGELVWRGKDPTRAEALFRSALHIFEETQSLRSGGIAKSNLGFLSLVIHNDLAAAREFLTSAEEHLRRASDTTQLASCLCRLGHLSLASGEDAQRYLDEASELAQRFSAESSGDLGESISMLARAQQSFTEGIALVRGLVSRDFWSWGVAR